MAGADLKNPLVGEMSCLSLLIQLQKIWGEVGKMVDKSCLRLKKLEEFLDLLVVLQKEKAEVEVQRLNQLKASRMKEIVLKLEEFFAPAPIEIETKAESEKILALISYLNLEPSELLGDMDAQIGSTIEEAFGRKDIPEEKMLAESWSESGNRIRDGQKNLTLDIEYEDWHSKICGTDPQSQVSIDIVRKILSLSSRESLCRFREGPGLRDIICDPCFSKYRSRRSILLVINSGFFGLTLDGTDFLDLSKQFVVNLERAPSPLCTKLDAFGRYDVYIIGELDGIILMEVEEDTNFKMQVYNPATRETTLLPNLPYKVLECRHVVNRGMIYMKSSNDYMYVVVTDCHSSDFDHDCHGAWLELYSLKQQRWVHKKEGMKVNPFGGEEGGTFFKDSLYWLTVKNTFHHHRWGCVSHSETSITRLSAESLEFSVIKFPTEKTEKKLYAECLGTIEGNLCMVTIDNDNVVDIWRMDSRMDWSIMYSYQVTIHGEQCIDVLSITNDGKIICRCDGFVLYDLFTKAYTWLDHDSLDTLGDYFRHYAVEYTESFQKLPGEN